MISENNDFICFVKAEPTLQQADDEVVCRIISNHNERVEILQFITLSKRGIVKNHDILIPDWTGLKSAKNIVDGTGIIPKWFPKIPLLSADKEINYVILDILILEKEKTETVKETTKDKIIDVRESEEETVGHFATTKK